MDEDKTKVALEAINNETVDLVIPYFSWMNFSCFPFVIRLICGRIHLIRYIDMYDDKNLVLITLLIELIYLDRDVLLNSVVYINFLS